MNATRPGRRHRRTPTPPGTSGSGAASTSSGCRISCCRVGGSRSRSSFRRLGTRCGRRRATPERDRGVAGGTARPDPPRRRAVRHRDRPPAGARGGSVGRRRGLGVTIRRGAAVTGLITDAAHAGAPGGRCPHRGRHRDPCGPGGGLRRAADGPGLLAAGDRRAGADRGTVGLRLRLLLRHFRPVPANNRRRWPTCCRTTTRCRASHYRGTTARGALCWPPQAGTRRCAACENRLAGTRPSPGIRCSRTGRTANRSPASTCWPASRTGTGACVADGEPIATGVSRSATRGRAPIPRSAAARRWR